MLLGLLPWPLKTQEAWLHKIQSVVAQLVEHVVDPGPWVQTIHLADSAAAAVQTVEVVFDPVPWVQTIQLADPGAGIDQVVEVVVDFVQMTQLAGSAAGVGHVVPWMGLQQ